MVTYNKPAIVSSAIGVICSFCSPIPEQGGNRIFITDQKHLVRVYSDFRCGVYHYRNASVFTSCVAYLKEINIPDSRILYGFEHNN